MDAREEEGTVTLPTGRQALPYAWDWRRWLPERKGQRCRVVARGAMGGILVEFEDGFRVVTSRWAVRRIRGDNRRGGANG